MVALSGRGLRFVLLAEIRARGSMNVGEMVEFLCEQGYEVEGRPSKVVSDALRWEVARGRVVRVRRGVYRYGRVPSSTARRVVLFAERCGAWVGAVLRLEEPVPTPPTRADRVQWPWQGPECPDRPPWQHLGWLWTA
jgi:hypothetical protein